MDQAAALDQEAHQADPAVAQVQALRVVHLQARKLLQAQELLQVLMFLQVQEQNKIK